MRKIFKIETPNINLFKKKLLNYGNKLNPFIFLDSQHYNNSEHTYYKYDFIAAFGSLYEMKESSQSNFEKLSQFNQQHKDWIFGYLSYDLKNELENLSSKNTDNLEFPDIHFFVPPFVIISENKNISMHYHENQFTIDEAEHILHQIETIELPSEESSMSSVSLLQRFTRDEYVSNVNKLREHIQQGDIYEVNFCQELYGQAKIDPITTYNKLCEVSPTPFSSYYKNNNHFLLCASPERFIKKISNKILSQPIKGTIKRGSNTVDDDQLKDKLQNDPKERAENVMIVDLVRNDLSQTAIKNSVKVEELCGIYSFKQVHQMMSTIVSEINEKTDIIDVIKKAFPMGSMTGAPKVKAMELIEKYERTKRGLYSGSIGYISPEKDFDFNVVIRSILYNQHKKYVSFTVGGAITNLAKAEDEYEECMIKANAMIRVLKN